jgi:DNA polymerase elongation subunit (family B)
MEKTKYGNYLRDGDRVAVRYRDEGGNRQVDYHTQYPCFYINPRSFWYYDRDGSKREIGDFHEILKLLDGDDRVVSYKEEGQTVLKSGLLKVEVKSRSHVRSFLRNYGPIYGADLDQQDAVIIDNDLNISEYKQHIGYFDIEALQFKRDDPAKWDWLQTSNKDIWHDQQMVNSIVFYSNYFEKYTAFGCHPDFERKNAIHDWGSEHLFKTEYDMLTSFADWLFSMDFDLITGWNSAGYDLSVLYHRMESLKIAHPYNYMVGKTENGLFPKKVFGGGAMSPYGIMDAPWFKGGKEYRWQQQPIRGIDTLDLMVAFRRIYKDSTNNELPSNRLNMVATKLFGHGKNPSPDFYSKEYNKDWDKFLQYNIRDVELLVEIDEAYNVINSYKILQNLVGCQLKSTFYATYLARVMFSKEAYWQQITPRYETDEADKDDEELKGAIVLNPDAEPDEREDDDDDVYTGSVGIHDWTVILDFAGLYPSIMMAFNTCHSTIVRPGMPHLDDDMIGHRGVRFRKNPVGVLPRMVMSLDEQRDEYKAKLKEAEMKGDKKETLKWNTMQLGVKRLRASFYGILAFDKFSWHNRDMAATITMGGRNALLSIKDLTEEMGFKVVFGHTDSIFVTMPKEWTKEKVLDESQRLAKTLTTHVQKEVRSDKVVVELEAIMDRFFIAKKNRYAGRKVWDDKKGFKVMEYDINEDPWARIKMSGFEAKHTNTAPVGRDIQIESLKDIFDGVPENRIRRRARKLVREVISGEIDKEMLVANAKVGKHLPHHLNWHGEETDCDCGSCPAPKTGDESQDEDACYVDNFWISKMSKWYNSTICSNDGELIQKGDSISWTLAIDGPTGIPAGGYVAFRDIDEINEYVLDYEALAERHVRKKMENIYSGMGWDIRELDPSFTKLNLSQFSETSKVELHRPTSLADSQSSR